MTDHTELQRRQDRPPDRQPGTATVARVRCGPARPVNRGPSLPATRGRPRQGTRRHLPRSPAPPPDTGHQTDRSGGRGDGGPGYGAGTPRPRRSSRLTSLTSPRGC
jgi:hypothetical protein